MTSRSLDQQRERMKDDLLKTTLSMLMESTSKTKTKHLADRIEDNFLICKICNDKFDNPKCLNCLHSFCEQCLDKHVMQLEQTRYKKFSSCEYREITCPVCSKRTPLPMGGVKKLPDNFIVNGLTDVIIKQKPSDIINCDVCKVSKGSTPGLAKLKCMECNKHLCRDCASFHKETKVTKHHSLFDLNFEKEIQCFDHVDEVVRFYCETCEKCVCVVCTFEGHHTHEVTSFEEASAKFTEPIKQLAKQCQQKLAHSEEALEKLERCESLIRCVEQCVKDKVVEMMSNLKIRESQLLEEVRKTYGTDLLKKISQKKEFIMQIENMKNSSKLTEVVLDGKNMEFLLLKKTIESKLSLIASLDEKLYSLPPSVDKLVEFRPSSFSFGYIYDYDDPDPCNQPKVVEQKNIDKIVSISVGTSTDPPNTLEKKDQNLSKLKAKLIDEGTQSTPIKHHNPSVQNIESQTDPLGLDFLIASYKCERKYSPGKDMFYNTPTSAQKQISQLFTPTINSFSKPPLKGSLPPTTKKIIKYILPEIPTFRSLSATKEITTKNDNTAFEKKCIKNNLENKQKPALTELEKKGKNDSMLKDAAIILKEPFTELKRVLVSPPPVVFNSNSNTNGLLAQEITLTEPTQNISQKVIATVAPTICSLAKSTCQTVPTLTLAPIQTQTQSKSFLKDSSEDKKVLNEKPCKSAFRNSNTESVTSKCDKSPDKLQSVKTSNKGEVGLRRKVRDSNLTHLSDSPLFRKSNLSSQISSTNTHNREHKSPSKYSTNPALQLYYQTLGSQKPSSYGSSKLNFRSPYSSHSNRASDGYKYNSYKFP